MSDSDVQLNWSQQRTLDTIKPEDMEAARQSYRDTVARHQEEALRESNINGWRRVIQGIRKTIGHCPFRESLDDLWDLCDELEAKIKADKEKT